MPARGGVGAVMDVGEWLRGIGLEQYEAAFRENAIYDAILPSLTADDPKDLGVGIVGHRRKLLDAIAALRADGDAKAAQPLTSSTTNTSSQDTAERRQVTVMFSDLVGSKEEAELLLRRWSRAKSGEGQVVLLSGEAGIGKSRLTAALMENLATEPHTLAYAISVRRNIPTARFIRSSARWGVPPG